MHTKELNIGGKKYTMKNLLDYVYEKIGIEDFFHEEKKDIKSIEYLLNKYLFLL